MVGDMNNCVRFLGPVQCLSFDVVGHSSHSSHHNLKCCLDDDVKIWLFPRVPNSHRGQAPHCLVPCALCLVLPPRDVRAGRDRSTPWSSIAVVINTLGYRDGGLVDLSTPVEGVHHKEKNRNCIHPLERSKAKHDV